MDKEKKQQMRAFSKVHEDTPDGAFFALAEEEGITQDDCIEEAEEPVCASESRMERSDEVSRENAEAIN